MIIGEIIKNKAAEKAALLVRGMRLELTQVLPH